MAADSLLRFRFPATCARCGAVMPAGTRGRWNRELKQATCTGCLAHSASDIVPVDRGEAGGSAVREWRRRRDRREAQVRGAHPRIGGLILALSEQSQSMRAWARGAEGERLLGAALDALRAEGIAVLHDRRIPGSRANIDHLLVSSAGVFVVDAKRYKGKVESRDQGGFFSSDVRLFVGGRDRSTLVAGMQKQVEAVRVALDGTAAPSCPLIPVLCFVDSDWGLFASPLRVGGVRVLWPKMLGKLIRSKGELSPAAVAELERQLALALPAA